VSWTIQRAYSLHQTEPFITRLATTKKTGAKMTAEAGAEARQYGQYEEAGNSPYDLVGALSGYGGDCPEGIPVEFGLLSILAAFGVAFGILYTALTIQIAGGRKRRNLDAVSGQGTCEAAEATLRGFYGCHISNFVSGVAPEGGVWYRVADVLWHGLEEFEEKIDKIAEGQDSGEENWISRIYNQFSVFNDVDNKLAETDLEGIEPPILDETWGLGLRNASSFKKVTANATVEEPVKLEEEEVSRKKREVTEEAEDDEEAEIADTEEKCRVDMWRCLSRVIEGGLHYIDNPDGLYGLAKKTMFKVAFHGGMSNVWSGLMTIPEARQIKKCMTSHQECVSYEVLRREAQETMDPTDPSYGMYDNKMKEGKVEEKFEKKKRERLIINPEFVESMDQGDGAEEFDSDPFDYNNEV